MTYYLIQYHELILYIFVKIRISGSRNTNTCLFEQLVSIDSAIAIVVSLSIYRYEQLNKETVVTSKQSKAKKEERKWGESLWWSLRAGLIDASSAELTWPLQMISSPGQVPYLCMLLFCQGFFVFVHCCWRKCL